MCVSEFVGVCWIATSLCVCERDGRVIYFVRGANGNHCLSYSSCLVHVCRCGNVAVLGVSGQEHGKTPTETVEIRGRMETRRQEKAGEKTKYENQTTQMRNR